MLPEVMPHDLFLHVFSPGKYFGEMFGGGLGIRQLDLVLGDLAGDWALANVALIPKNFCKSGRKVKREGGRKNWS